MRWRLGERYALFRVLKYIYISVGTVPRMLRAVGRRALSPLTLIKPGEVTVVTLRCRPGPL